MVLFHFHTLLCMIQAFATCRKTHRDYNQQIMYMADWPCKIIFYIIDYTIYKVKFKIKKMKISC